jgi:hypothetical protein
LLYIVPRRFDVLVIPLGISLTFLPFVVFNLSKTAGVLP